MDTAPEKQKGCMVAVVGPSGAGKDTLMAHAAEALQGRDDVVFVRRVITRDASAGGENHHGVSVTEFEALEESGHFAVSWGAHGLFYGIPADTKDAVAAGHLVIANGSRSALPDFKAAYPRLVVVNITARPEVLAARLEARGRESREDILLRLQRSTLTIGDDYDVVTIDNSDALEDSARSLIEALQALVATGR